VAVFIIGIGLLYTYRVEIANKIFKSRWYVMSQLTNEMDLQRSFPENLMTGGYPRLFIESQSFMGDVAKEICKSSSPKADLLYLHAISRSDSGLLNDLLHELMNSECITTAVAVQYLDEQSQYRMTDDFQVLADGFIHALDDYETSTSQVDLLFGNYEIFTETLRTIADDGDEMAYLQYHNHWQFIAMGLNANKTTFKMLKISALADEGLIDYVKDPLRSVLMNTSRVASSEVVIVF
jgi:hypothetical protein